MVENNKSVSVLNEIKVQILYCKSEKRIVVVRACCPPSRQVHKEPITDQRLCVLNALVGENQYNQNVGCNLKAIP